jgi:hypothetical protein
MHYKLNLILGSLTETLSHVDLYIITAFSNPFWDIHSLTLLQGAGIAQSV